MGVLMDNCGSEHPVVKTAGKLQFPPKRQQVFTQTHKHNVIEWLSGAAAEVRLQRNKEWLVSTPDPYEGSPPLKSALIPGN